VSQEADDCESERILSHYLRLGFFEKEGTVTTTML
jgi:hypothetical protein